MNTEVIKLMKVLKPILTEKIGEVQTNNEGEKYRYDMFIKRNENGYTIPYYIKLAFEKAVISLGLPSYKQQFKVDNYTFTILKNKAGKCFGVAVDKFNLL